MDKIWIFFVVLFLGAVIQGATGFGIAIFCMAILPFFIPFKTAVVAVLFSSFIMTINISIKLRKKINFKLMIYPVLAAAIGRILGVTGLTYFDETILRYILGALLVILSIYFAFYSKKIKIKANAPNGLTAGLSSGILGGMFNIGGPPLVAYYFSVVPDKEEYMATTQATFVISSIFSVLINIFYGNVNQDVLMYTVFGFFAVLFGSWLGLHIFRKINRAVLSKVIYCFMAIMGIITLIKA